MKKRQEDYNFLILTFNSHKEYTIKKRLLILLGSVVLLIAIAGVGLIFKSFADGKAFAAEKTNIYLEEPQDSCSATNGIYTECDINQLYQDVLGRSADDGGKAYYLAVLNDGSKTYNAVRSELAYSNEYAQTIARIYQACLLQDPEEGEVGYWQSRIAGVNSSIASIAVEISYSQKAKDKGSPCIIRINTGRGLGR